MKMFISTSVACIRAFLAAAFGICLAYHAVDSLGTCCGDNSPQTARSDQEFVLRLLASDPTEEDVERVAGRSSAVPVMAAVARASEAGDPVRKRVVGILTELLFMDNVEAARNARFSLLSLANPPKKVDEAEAALVALDKEAKAWLLSNTTPSRAELYPELHHVTFQRQNLDARMLRWLRMARWEPFHRGGKNWELGSTLGVLCFYNTNLCDDDLKYLNGLAELELLDVTGSAISGAGMRGLDLPKLDFVRMDHCPMTDDTLKCVNLPQLKALYFAFTKVGNRGLRDMRAGKIEELGIYGTNVTSDGLQHLKRFTCLDTVALDAGIVNTAGIGHLRRCRNLRRVVLHGEIPAGFTLEDMQRSLPGVHIEVRRGIEQGDPRLEAESEPGPQR